ncbi:hypothetical protein EPA93_09225 [Ktedonosporobacter rubrisoli]|uniref:Uncharacterized protein n=1 Tax=Ktedonosporobacter rubrisoli TaxID=2509675 RepID=A0A4P6JMA6_KTERU|nr:hypothetical protein [Ktedonosporobacter rubrisoli]QBD76180.1 hypothetical protein EPA93_09225 [Ktedonosporobacter rubrisoli]
MTQRLKRGILASFSNASYTASVLILEATNTLLQNVPVATHLDGTSAQAGALCAVLFFDEHNPADAVVIAVYPNGGTGVPTPAPGRLVFVAGYQQVANANIAANATSTFTLTGGSSGIPAGALGVLFSANFTSSSSGAYIQLAPHASGAIGNYAAIGNLPAANAFLNGSGLLQLDSHGQVDIKANVAACTVSLYTQGYLL